MLSFLAVAFNKLGKIEWKKCKLKRSRGVYTCLKGTKNRGLKRSTGGLKRCLKGSKRSINRSEGV